MDPFCYHGTHLAGLIVGDPERGVPGLCPLCKIFPVKIVGGHGGKACVTDAAIIRAIRYILRLNRLNGGVIRIVNLSFGKFACSPEFRRAVRQLTDSGVLLVSAVGNEGVSEPVYPAALPEVLSVTALGPDGRRSWYANFGPWVDLAAPGGNASLEEFSPEKMVCSMAPGGGYTFSQGTSVAAPVVSGLAGLLLLLRPGASALELRERILSSADPFIYGSDLAGAFNRPWNSEIRSGTSVALPGVGLVDALAAVQGTIRQRQDGQGFEDRLIPLCGALGAKRGNASGKPVDWTDLIAGFWFIIPFFIVVLVIQLHFNA